MRRREFLAGMGLAAGALQACASVSGAGAQNAAVRSVNSGARALDATALDDALLGSSYLGCGGGGSLKDARALIRADLDAGRRFDLLDVANLADDDRVCSPYALGSLAPPSAEMTASLEAIEDPVENVALAAFRLLERHLDTQFAGVILGEIGPLSMAEGLSAAAELGVPALDADTVGRAVPEINQHSVKVAGLPLTPAAGVTPFGDEVIIESLKDPKRGETLFRSLAQVSEIIGVADGPITGKDAKAEGTLVTGSFTLARRMGEAIRLARASGDDPIEAARLAGDGFTLFTGEIVRFDWGDRDGFLAGDLLIRGTGFHSGRVMHLDYKNEHLVARWGSASGRVVATCPDLITLIDETSHEGITNPEFEEGQAVRVLGFRSHPIWRQPAGLSVFSPRYFGYDIDYVPIEQRLR